MRWLALDVGSRRVGVAVSDAAERVVTPLQALEHREPGALAEAVATLVEERGIGGVAVGVPLTRSGQGRGEARVAAVLAALREKLAVPLQPVDERGSTKEAEALLLEAGTPRRRWHRVVDSLAARVILERLLTERARRDSRGAVDRGGNEC